MKKNLKRICIIILGITSSIVFANNVHAATANILVSKNVNQVVVGQSVKFTVTISSASPLGSWDFDVGVSGGTMTAGQGHIVDYAGSSNQKSKSYSYTIKATSKGTISLNIRNSLVYGFDLQKMSVSNGSSSVKVITQKELEASYSNNNNLKSLFVEGYEIIPAFNKEILEYNVELPPNVEKIKVIATKEDGTATVTGDGEIDVSEGDNKIEIVVVSQKGNKKTYILNAKVIDNNPIETTVNGKKLIVIKKVNNLKIPTAFEEVKLDINGQEIPGFYSNIAKIYLVGLKDEYGNSKLYIYNKKKNIYTIYNELKSNNIVFYYIEKEKFDNKLKKTTIKILDNEIKVFKYNDKSNFSFIYGMNLENGSKSWYLHDEIEGTFQRYNNEQIKDINEKLNTYFIIIGALGICLLIEMIIIIIQIVNNKKRKKIYNKAKKNDKKDKKVN